VAPLSVFPPHPGRPPCDSEMLKFFWQRSSLGGCCLFSAAEEYLRTQPAPLPRGTVSNCTRRAVEAFNTRCSETRIKHGRGGGEAPTSTMHPAWSFKEANVRIRFSEKHENGWWQKAANLLLASTQHSRQ